MVYFFIGSAYLIGFFGCGACYGVFQTLRSYLFFTSDSEDDDEDEEDEDEEEDDDEEDDRFLLF